MPGLWRGQRSEGCPGHVHRLVHRWTSAYASQPCASAGAGGGLDYGAWVSHLTLNERVLEDSTHVFPEVRNNQPYVTYSFRPRHRGTFHTRILTHTVEAACHAVVTHIIGSIVPRWHLDEGHVALLDMYIGGIALDFPSGNLMVPYQPYNSKCIELLKTSSVPHLVPQCSTG